MSVHLLLDLFLNEEHNYKYLGRELNLNGVNMIFFFHLVNDLQMYLKTIENLLINYFLSFSYQSVLFDSS